jgi:50S ribosomal subunit-associated GTPase HflX
LTNTTSKQIHNLEKLTGVQVIDRKRLILTYFILGNYNRGKITD